MLSILILNSVLITFFFLLPKDWYIVEVNIIKNS